jgi:hypothetical protein
MIVVLGNRHAIESHDHGETFVKLPKGKRSTLVEIPEGYTLLEALTAIVDPRGHWPRHSADGKPPAWVASDSPGLANLLAEHFGGVEVRELEVPDWQRRGEDGSAGGSSAGAVQAMLPTMLATVLALMLAIPVLAWVFARTRPLLLTNAGKDMVAAQIGGSASATAVAKWTALTANVTAPSASDTTLTGEITTGGGGLIRKTGTYAHTGGTATYTMTTVFTANGSDALPVTIGKRGVFDAASVGNMVFETLVSPTATLSASGDQLTLTDTVTIS